ncbi:MAG: HAD family phosphatase [Butyrivibrio sp.]|nr:HAD family phosphatase [Butyrivibrio sp.]
MLDGIRACFFDMDGTILDSMWVWQEIDKEFFAQRGMEMPGDIQGQIDGMSFSQTAEYFKRRFGLPESVDEIKSIWNKMAMDKYRGEVPLKRGVREFLERLKRGGIRTGIATSNSIELALCCLASLDAEKYFDTVVTSCDVGAGKPAPDVYLKCAENCGVKPEECLVFEDIVQGIMAGHNAGMKVCAVYDKYSEASDAWKRKAADYYIEDFTDIQY